MLRLNLNMSTELDPKTANYLLALKIISQNDLVAGSDTLNETVSRSFENGLKVSPLVQEIYKARGLPIPQYLNHLKVSSQTAAQLYNWNYLNEVRAITCRPLKN